MPRNGAGVFSLVNNTWFPPVNGVLATSTDWSTFISDIASALTQSVSSDGQTPMTGNLPMGNNKITGLANGTAVTDGAAYGQVPHATGQCRLTKSGLNLLLSPFNGNQITINGALQTIPAAGVTLAVGAAVALTLYYIYAFMVGAVMTLEFSTTTHATDATTGVEIKSGDSTRTLVGMARPIAGPAWVDTNAQRLVLSWFNRRPLALGAVLAANSGNSGTSYSILVSQLLLEYLIWGSDTIQGAFQGELTNNLLNSVSATSIFIDAAANESYTATGAYTANASQPVYCSITPQVALTEGYHFNQVYAKQSAVSTATYTGSGTPGTRCVHSAVIQG